MGRRRKRRREVLVSNGLEFGNMLIQGMAAEVWRSIFCTGKLLSHGPHFLVSSAWGLGLCLAEALTGVLSRCLFEEAAFKRKLNL